jgi:hypothetical protein
MAADLHVEVRGAEIVVTLPFTSYTVTYYKPANSSQAGMTNAEFLAKAWRLANDEARELGWIA